MPALHTHTHTGQCLCGRIQLSITQFNREVVACHCTQCRKQSGHFVAATRAENQHLSIEGKEFIRWYNASDKAKRGFCKHCGSLLFWRSANSDTTSIMAGCLDGHTGLRLIGHIFVNEKGDYYQLEPDLPQS